MIDRTRAIEALAAVTGLAGATLLATDSAYTAWGWVAFLCSNFAWIRFGVVCRHWFLVLMQLGFMVTSITGIRTWLL